MPAYSHKNWRIREEMCIFLQECLLRYGVVGATNGQLYVSKFIPPLVILVSDQNVQVRETSMSTLVEIYKHVGDKLRNEIIKKHSNMPHQKYVYVQNICASVSLFIYFNSTLFERMIRLLLCYICQINQC